jgi:hypothetical protein
MNRQQSLTSKLLVIAMGAAALALVTIAFVSPLRESRDLVEENVAAGNEAEVLANLDAAKRQNLQLREEGRLKKEPLDASALVNLWVLIGLDGNEKDAQPFALEASQRSLRDPMAQLVAVRAYLEKKDLKQAFHHLDGLLTANPEMYQSTYPSVLSLLGTSEAVAALADVLKRNPNWRNPLLLWLIRHDTSNQITFRLFGEIRKAGGEIYDGELRSYLAWLLQQKANEKAYFVWLDTLDQTQLLKVSSIFDGQFDLDARNLSFDWNIDSFANADISIAQRPDASGNRNLRLVFYNSNNSFGHVYQYLRLQPGKYVINGEWSASNLVGGAGLRWRLTCVEKSAMVGQTQAFNQSSPWTAFTSEFEVPGDGCQTQFLRLQTASDAVLDAKLDGELRFDNMRIEPVPSVGQEN